MEVEENIKENAQNITNNETISLDVTPKETLYVSNLNQKLSKEELKRSLYTLFSRYGAILDIVVCKNKKLNGQAWIIFTETSFASSALKHLQQEQNRLDDKQFKFFGRKMRLSYAKTKSDVVLSQEELRVKKEKRFEDKKRKRDDEVQLDDEKNKKQKIFHTNENKEEEGEPNKILFVENLPPSLDQKTLFDTLKKLFGEYEGFEDIRVAPGKGVAFVEYSNEKHAATALEVTNNFNFGGRPLGVTFAKKG